MPTSEEPNAISNESALPLPGRLDGLPADLAAVLALALATVSLALVPGFRVPGARIVVGLVFVLFAPGYAFVAALFPERARTSENETGRPVTARGIGGVERLTLSLGMSVAIVPLFALLLNLSPLPFDLESVLAVLGAFTATVSLVAVKRRHALVDARRFRVPYRRWLRSARSGLSTDSPVDAVPVLVVVASLLIAGVGVSQTVTQPRTAETYTEFYLLSGTEEGVGTATNYTTDLTSGEEHSVVVGIGNQERLATDYVVVVRLQRMRQQGNVSTPVASEVLTRFETTVASNRTTERRTAFRPELTGERLRLQFLLYRGEVPPDLSAETAYREAHLWVSVS